MFDIETSYTCTCYLELLLPVKTVMGGYTFVER